MLLDRILILTLLLSGLASGASAAAITFAPPTGDRWMYPFNSTPGTRPVAPTFGATSGASSEILDDRDAELLVQFNTAPSVPSGLGAANYQIVSARLTVTVQSGAFAYDPTYDAYTSYLGTDSDLDRSIELYGVGYRNGFTTLSFQETSPFSPPGPPAERTRNAFPTDFAGGLARDASNNVADGFDPTPFAVGAIAGLAPGASVPAGSEVTFDLALSPDVLAYLQGRLDLGRIDLLVTSMHTASQGGPVTYPTFWTKDGNASSAPRLVLDVNVVPEPASAWLAAAGMALAAVARGRRRAR